MLFRSGQYCGFLLLSNGYYGYSIVPKHADIRLYGDDEPGCSGWNWVSGVFSFNGGANPPPPPPNPPNWFRTLGSWQTYLKNPDMTPYSGATYDIHQWNTTSDAWETFTKGGVDIYIHDSNYDVGNLFWGLYIYVPSAAYFECINPI